MPPETEKATVIANICMSAVWFLSYASRQTDRQTDRHTHHNTSHPSQKQSEKKIHSILLHGYTSPKQMKKENPTE